MSQGRKLSAQEIEFLSRERPYVLFVMQTQMLYDVANFLETISERLINVEALLVKPKGYVVPINVEVTKTEVLNFISATPYTPLFSVSLFNDGPDEVYPSVNDLQNRTPLKPGENISLDFHAPKIEKLFLDVDEGKKAKIRGFGLY